MFFSGWKWIFWCIPSFQNLIFGKHLLGIILFTFLLKSTSFNIFYNMYFDNIWNRQEYFDNYFLNLFILFIYFWLRWVFIAAHGLSLAVAIGGYSSLRCAGFSLQWFVLLQSTGSRRAGFSSCGMRALECRLSSCGARA